jgi:FSR family fosmidomycin resistance protein-like MFS transporter
MTDIAARNQLQKSAHNTAFVVLFAISFCHLVNDMMQSLLSAIYPSLKSALHLNFSQIGFITLAYQATASLLQPAIGFAADRRPMPWSLPCGVIASLAGLVVLSLADSYWMVVLSAILIGSGSAVFHPESSRVARMASGGRHGLAQALFQVGGNTGQALGPLTAALIVALYGQRSIAWYAGLALLGMIVLWNVGRWYKHHGLARMGSHRAAQDSPLPKKKVMQALFILLLLIFSKYFYLSSISSYYTFYLIHTFGLSVRQAQLHLFVFLAAIAFGTLAGGWMGDHFGRKYVIWGSILGALPFTLMLPHADLFWTTMLSAVIGFVMSSAFPAIVVYAQDLLPGKIGMVAGLFFGYSFGVAGLGAAALGVLADHTDITFVYQVCAFLPAIGLLTVFLPDICARRRS